MVSQDLMTPKLPPLPVIGPIPQVLLLCGRENLNARQAEHVVRLCGAIDDWRAFVEQAEFRLILPLVYPVAIGGAPIRVVRGPDFFTYLCRHHTRHHWARLHWIADLDAIFHSPGFDLASAQAQAKRRGFGRTVEAACAIHRAAAEPEPWNAAFDDPFAREVFRCCLLNLEGDYERERELRAAFPTTDIDIEPARRWLRQALRRNLGRFRPSGEDFLHLPLPHRWHGAFYALRPLLWTIRTVRKAWRPGGLTPV